MTEEKAKSLPPRNPNKRPCVARNISFSVQRENEHWLRTFAQRPWFIGRSWS